MKKGLQVLFVVVMILSFASVTTGTLAITSSVSEASWLSKTWKKAKRKLSKFVKNLGKEIVNGYAKAVTAVCKNEKSHGISLRCFGAGKRGRLKKALNFMSEDSRAIAIGSSQGRAYDLVRKYTSLYANGDSLGGQIFLGGAFTKDYNAYYIGLKGAGRSPVVINASAFSNLPTDGQLAAMLTHEADHGRFGQHTCGLYQDTDESGPYGTQTKYLIKIYREGHPTRVVSSADRGYAFSSAWANVYSKFCDNSSVRNRLIQLLLFSW